MPQSFTGRLSRITCLVALFTVASAPPALAGDTSPIEQARLWNQQAGTPGDADRGEAFFTTRHGGKWSCASCHDAPPISAGRHAATGKRLKPLAPTANPQAFTETKRIDKWFRRNCNDVLKRECSAREKADVIAYLLSLQH